MNFAPRVFALVARYGIDYIRKDIEKRRYRVILDFPDHLDASLTRIGRNQKGVGRFSARKSLNLGNKLLIVVPKDCTG